MEPRFAFFDGRVIPYAEARLPLLTHAFNYGTSVVSGVRGYWNNEEGQLFLFRPAGHFQGLRVSAKLLGMEVTASEQDLVTSAVELLRAESIFDDCYVRAVAYYGDESLGIRIHDLTTEVSMVAVPYGHYGKADTGIHVTISSWRSIDGSVIPAAGRSSALWSTSPWREPRRSARVSMKPSFSIAPVFGSINATILQDNSVESSGSSIYHGFAVSVAKRYRDHYPLRVSYTFGKAIDDTIDFITDLQAANQLDLRAERALSSFDQRHRLVISGVLASPLERGDGLGKVRRCYRGADIHLLVGTPVQSSPRVRRKPGHAGKHRPPAVRRP